MQNEIPTESTDKVSIGINLDVSTSEVADELKNLIKEDKHSIIDDKVDAAVTDIFTRVSKRHSRLIGLNDKPPSYKPEQFEDDMFAKKVAMYNRAQVLFTVHLTNYMSNQLGVGSLINAYDIFQRETYGTKSQGSPTENALSTHENKTLPEEIEKMMSGYIKQISVSYEMFNRVNNGLDAAMVDDVETLKKEWKQLTNDEAYFRYYDIDYQSIDNI